MLCRLLAELLPGLQPLLFWLLLLPVVQLLPPAGFENAICLAVASGAAVAAAGGAAFAIGRAAVATAGVARGARLADALAAAVAAAGGAAFASARAATAACFAAGTRPG
jgi:hypothetical protein